MNGPNNFELHEVLLYGSAQERVVWVYGDLNGNAQTQVKFGADTIDVRPQVQDSLGVAGSLSVNGKSTYRVATTATAPKVTVTRDAAGSTFSVRANANVSGVYYSDGNAWFKLAGSMRAGSVIQATASSTAGLRGVGNLTEAEADALGASLRNQGAMVVAALPETEIPDALLAVQPAPRRYLRTGLYVQQGAPVALAPAPATPVTPPPTQPPTTGGTITVREITRGSNSTFSGAAPAVFVARSASDLASAWRLANGNQIPIPPVPSVTFTGNTAVTIFMGQRPTGGYGIRVVSAQASGDTLTITAELASPPPGAITTQALTSPWVLLQVSGAFTRVIVQDTSGRVVVQSQ